MMNPEPYPFITILMPIYNGIEFMKESVASVFAQQGLSPSMWELIIGINGHPKNSPTYIEANEIVRKLRLIFVNGMDFQVSIIDLYDLTIKGKSAALNKMVNSYTNLQSNWIALLDVDDVWHPHKLMTQIKFLIPIKEMNTSIMYPAYDVVGSQSIYFGTDAGKKDGLSPEIPVGNLSGFDFLKVNPIINSSVIIRKKYAIWNSAEDGVEDYDLWLSLKLRNCLFYNCPEKLIRHRLHNSSAFNSSKGGNNNKVIALKQKYVSQFRENIHTHSSTICNNIMKCLLHRHTNSS